MRGSYYLLLIFPVCIFVAGFMVLRANLRVQSSVTIPVVNIDSMLNESQRSDTIISGDKTNKRINREVRTGRVVKKGNVGTSGKTDGGERALPYFILSAVFVILILALPRLSELSISDKSIVLKLFDEVKAAADDLANGTKEIGNESFKARPPDANIQRLRDRIDIFEKVLKKSKS